MLALIATVEAGDSQLRVLLDSRAFPVDDTARVEARAQREERYVRLEQLKGRACGDSVVTLVHSTADIALVQGRDLGLTGNAAGARPWLDRSVKQHRQLLMAGPTYVQPDEVAHAMGVALLAMDATQEGMDTLTRLVNEHPDSPYAPDAYTRLGDIWFAREDAYKAYAAFERAEAAHDPATWPYARYMLDRCLYNVGDTEDALRGHLALAALPVGDPFARHLRAEVLAELPRLFADSGQVAEGTAYFMAVGRPDLGEAMNAWLQSRP